ncbi:helix-turn-helix domain-containing protein [Actinokineospora sp. NPDC004072]
MVGVPKFDRAEVLLNAAREFAARGYEGASVSRLVEATGLLRGSLYGAFGSKAGLFRLAFAAAVQQSEDRDLVVDLLTVALRERAAVDPDVVNTARAVITTLDATGTPPAEHIYRRLTARAGMA